MGVRGDRFFTVCWTGLSEGAKNVKIFVSHVNAHRRETSAEEDFSSHVDRRTCSVDAGQLPSPVTPLSSLRSL